MLLRPGYDKWAKARERPGASSRLFELEQVILSSGRSLLFYNIGFQSRKRRGQFFLLFVRHFKLVERIDK